MEQKSVASQKELEPEMVTLKGACNKFGWKPRTVREWIKKGKFVQAYRQPRGRMLLFKVEDCRRLATASPVHQVASSVMQDIMA